MAQHSVETDAPRCASGAEGGSGHQTGATDATAAPARGLDAFHAAFHERYPAGHAPPAALPGILAAAGLPASMEDVQATLNQVCPLITDPLAAISYTQCREVYLHLSQERQPSADQPPAPAKAGCLARWMATDRGAANLLMVIVILLCALSAFLAAGLAILLLFLDGLATVGRHLQDDLGVVQDTLEVFASQIATQTADQQAGTLATTLAVVLTYIGYLATIETEGAHLLKLAASVSNAMSAWLSTSPEQMFLGLAALAAALTNASLARYGVAQTGLALSGINTGGMPANYELALARWANASIVGNSSVVEYLTTFRYPGQCPNRVCVTNATVTAPMAAALAGGGPFARLVMDYRATAAFGGFTTTGGLGVEVQVSWSGFFTKRFSLITALMQGWIADSTNSFEYLVAKVSAPGVGSLMASPLNCNTDCQRLLVTPGWPMYNALLGQTGVMRFTNHRGQDAMAAYTPVAGQPLALVIQMEVTDIAKVVLPAVVKLLDRLNTQYAQSSQEFELSTFAVDGGNLSFTHLTAYRYAGDCPAARCAVPPFLAAAAANCSTGVARTTDYRGRAVLVGYSCVGEVGAVLSVKVDLQDTEADTLQAILEAVDARTAADAATSAQFLLATPRAGLTAGDVRGYGDFEVKSRVKYPDSCVHSNCAWNSTSALRALQDLEDVIDTTDYRNVAVKAAPARSDALSYGVGLALETDTAELLQPMVDTAVRVGCFAAGMVFLSTLTLALTTKLFLRSMVAAREEGRRAVEAEKDRFGTLVSSMYPAYVVPQLLGGERQAVCDVPQAAVFFSDIHEFTAASNALGSRELLSLLGYVYGVMDRIADHFAVYKV
eukprot:EG_transcript_2628